MCHILARKAVLTQNSLDDDAFSTKSIFPGKKTIKGGDYSSDILTTNAKMANFLLYDSNDNSVS